jgi:hypothetical protein
LLSKKVFTLLFISLVTACSALDRDVMGKHVSGPMELSTGDIIRVVTVDIEDFRFQLTGVTEQAIEGKDLSIPFVKIRDIEVITPIRSSHDEVSESEIGLVFLVIITTAGLVMMGDSSSTYRTLDDVFSQ